MLIDGLEILTMAPDAAPVFGSIRIENGTITALGDVVAGPGEERIDATGCTALPGFVQGHVHLCQTLFRNAAEGLPLLDWLEQRIWPLEAAHDAASLVASASVALHDLIRGGCTTFQSMETGHGTEHSLEVVEQSGLRAIVGNSLMDRGTTPLVTTTRAALDTAERLRADWDGRAGRIFFAYCPRFLLSCSDDLHRAVVHARDATAARIHTHAAEHPTETDSVAAARSSTYIEALDKLGILGPTTSLAHCVHTKTHERDRLAATQTAVLHCPSTNLKLGSGIAPIHDYHGRGIRCAIGSDGAPANNRLDALTELRQGALLQDLTAGPGALAARTWLEILTRRGAEALGLADHCGTLETGKSADIVVLDLTDPTFGTSGATESKIVYAADRSAIRHVIAGGRFVLRDGEVTGCLGDRRALAATADREFERLLGRAGLT